MVACIEVGIGDGKGRESQDTFRGETEKTWELTELKRENYLIASLLDTFIPYLDYQPRF